MKDVRCMIGAHHWVKRQIENSQYVTCSRCGKDRTIYVHRMPFG